MTTVATPLTNLFATIGDPDGTRTITSIIALLVALGLGLAMVAVWMFRTTRPDPEVLAPLERMGERSWRRADPVAQRRALDDARPEGAQPLAPSAAPPTPDEAFDAGPTATGFDDLKSDAEADAAAADIPRLPPAGSSVPLAEGDPSFTVAEVTPQLIERPTLDEFADDIDPDVLAAADAELEAELRNRRDES